MRNTYELMASRSFEIHGTSVVIAELIDKLNLNRVDYIDKGKIKSWARLEFHEPYPKGIETVQIYIAFMYLLLKHVYPRIDTGGNGWIRVTPALEALTGSFNRNENDLIYRPISKKSITLRSHEDTKVMPIEILGNLIFRLLKDMSEDYRCHKIVAVHLHIYSAKRMPKKEILIPSDKKVISQLYECCILSSNLQDITDLIPINTENQTDNAKYPDYITKLKNKNQEKMEEYMKKMKDDPKCKAKPPKPAVFMVADLETIRLIEPEKEIGDTEKEITPQLRHYAYAAAYMKVDSDMMLSKSDIVTFSTYDHGHTESDFFHKSTNVLNDFLNHILIEGKKTRKAVTVYFHNMSKFDGVILADHLLHNRKEDLVVSPNIRNNIIYEINIHNK